MERLLMSHEVNKVKKYLALWLIEHGDKVVAQTNISILGFDVLLRCVDKDLIKEVTPNDIGLDSRYYRISEKGRDYVQQS
jgi:hypothetical protein